MLHQRRVGGSGDGRFAARRAIRGACLTLVVGVGAAMLVPAGPASAGHGKGNKITLRTVQVGEPGNRAVWIAPFQDGIYRSKKQCNAEKASSPPAACTKVGKVRGKYRIGQTEITVKQWVKFLNVADRSGQRPAQLYHSTESPAAWPKYGQITFDSGAKPGHHYRVAYPQWKNKPYGFADFLRAARFVNSVENGKILGKKKGTENGFSYKEFRVRLSPEIDRGMYDLRRHHRTGATREKDSGFVIPSQNEWIKAAYFDPAGGGTYSYWNYPTNPGYTSGGADDPPTAAQLDPATGAVTNAATQPLAIFNPNASPGDDTIPVPSWCPRQVSPQSDCDSVNPFGINPVTYGKLYLGSLGSVGQSRTFSPWGTLDQGGNAVEWTDTITDAPKGSGKGRVWRRLHGGVPNAAVYQLWISAIGLQPQDNAFYEHVYPWLGFRVAVTK